jgi:hypothetical protein
MNEQKRGQTPKMGRVVAVGMAVAMAVAIVGSSLLGQQGASAPKSGNHPEQSDSFSKQDEAAIAAAVLAHADVKKSLPGHELEVLRVVREISEVKPTNLPPTRKLAEVLLFDHTTGKSERVIFDADRSQVLQRETLSGSPSPTEQELSEANDIVVQTDAPSARLLKDGGLLTGGFLADAPAGSPPTHRYVTMQVLSPDHKQIQRMIVVDLTANAIALAK